MRSGNVCILFATNDARDRGRIDAEPRGDFGLIQRRCQCPNRSDRFVAQPMPTFMIGFGEWLHVVGVHATRILATVVKFIVSRDRPAFTFVHPSMRQLALGPDRHAGVPLVIGETLPNPASGFRIDPIEINRVRHRRAPALIRTVLAQRGFLRTKHPNGSTNLANDGNAGDIFPTRFSSRRISLLAQLCAALAAIPLRRLSRSEVVILNGSASLAGDGGVRSAGSHSKTPLCRVVSEWVGAVRETARRTGNYSVPSPLDSMRIIAI